MNVSKSYLEKIMPPYLWREKYKYLPKGEWFPHTAIQTIRPDETYEIYNAFHDCERSRVYNALICVGRTPAQAIYQSGRACSGGLIKLSSKYYSILKD